MCARPAAADGCVTRYIVKALAIAGDDGAARNARHFF